MNHGAVCSTLALGEIKRLTGKTKEHLYNPLFEHTSRKKEFSSTMAPQHWYWIECQELQICFI